MPQNQYQDLRTTGLQSNQPSDIYYKGVTIDKADKIFREGIVGEFYTRHMKRAVYITKNKKTAEDYAEQKNGVVIVINGNNLNIKPTEHSNQFMVEDYIPRQNIIDVYRVESVVNNPAVGRRGVETFEEQQKRKEMKEKREGKQEELGGFENG